MKLMCRRFSADAVVRPSIYKDKPEDPLGRHVADHVIVIPKRRPSTPGNTPSKPLEQHMTKNGDVSADTTADETGSTRKGLYSGGVRYFTVDDVRKRKDEVLKAKKSKSKERGEREVNQAEEKKKKNHTLSSSCTDVAVIKEKRSKSLSRSTPDINRGRSVSRTRQIDVPRLPFKDESLNDKEDKIASSTLKGRQASFHDSSEREHEGRRQEEEKKSLALSSSCTDIAVIKYKRSKSLSRSDPDVIRCRSVTRTRQVDGIAVSQLPFTDDKDDKTALSTLKGRQASFHDRFHDSNAVLKKGHNSSFHDSVGASLSRLRRSKSNETSPSPVLLNSERRIRMMKEKSMMTTGGADDRTTKNRGSGSYDIVERGRERSHSAMRNVVPPPPPRTMLSGGNVSDKAGDGWRNQRYQPRSLSLMEYGAIPSRRSLSTNRGRNRITNNIPPRRDVSPNQIDFARPKDLKFDSAEEKEEMKRNCARFMDKKNETHHNSRLRSSEDVPPDKKKAENSSRRNSILSSSSEPRTITRLSGVQYKGRDRNSQSQSRERNSRSQSRDRSSTVRYKAPPTLPTRSLFQNKPMFGTWGGSGVKVKEDWRNSRPLPCELKLLSR
jgi:hypothetical protein